MACEIDDRIQSRRYLRNWTDLRGPVGEDSQMSGMRLSQSTRVRSPTTREGVLPMPFDAERSQPGRIDVDARGQDSADHAVGC